MLKTGNLFHLAETQLIKEKLAGIIPCYTAEDVLEYAIEIRKWLDKNHRKIGQITKMTMPQRKLKRKTYLHQYYMEKKQ